MKHSYLLLALVLLAPITAHAQVLRYRAFGATPDTYPNKLKPGGTLVIESESFNWLKYKLNVQTAFYEREYKADLPKETGTATSPAKPDTPKVEQEVAGKVADRRIGLKQAAQEVTEITARYEAYQELVRSLDKTYKEDEWPTFETDKATRERLAGKAFSGMAATLTSREFVGQLQQWYDQLTQASAYIAAQKQEFNSLTEALPTRSTAARAKPKDLAAKENLAEAKAAKEALADAEVRQQFTQAAPGEKLAAELKRWLDNETEQKALAVLATAFVQLRDNVPPTSVANVPVPRDKDEVDVTLALVRREDYQVPPGAGLAGAPTPLKLTLFIAPRFRISASVGPYVSGLFDRQYSLAEDSLKREVTPAGGGTPTVSYVRRKRIVEETKDQWFDYVGATLLTHFEWHFAPELGVALSLGAGTQSSGFRFLVGPSLLVGGSQRGVLTIGFAGGQVSRLSRVYNVGDLVSPTVSVVPTRKANEGSLFVALTYNISSSRK